MTSSRPKIQPIQFLVLIVYNRLLMDSSYWDTTVYITRVVLAQALTKVYVE